MLVRQATEADLGAVRRVHAAAFAQADADGPPPEVGLLDALLAAGDVVPALSLVVVEKGVHVGHVAGSRARVGDRAAAAVGPVGVVPHAQGRGVGSALLHAVLAAADALELPLVGLLGAPGYYRRFGFVPATSLGIEPPEPSWADHFQVRTLAAYDERIRGPFRYAPAFAEL
ncbi:MAG TPA: N-acetyltransferase [Gaiellaceae bacterium]|nr:N-acetyltransferase [Gaiellaceae bacterium]